MDNLIKSITLKNFKGIDTKTISFSNCVPNQLTIIVGRNGSGKSTFRNALSYVKKKSIELEDEDIYKSDITKCPFSISFEGIFERKEYVSEATINKNELFDKFHIEIIDSPVYAKDISRKINGVSVGGARLESRDVEIIKLKEKVELNYSITSIKDNSNRLFSKCFNNLSSLFKNVDFIKQYETYYYDYRKQKRLISMIELVANNLEDSITNGLTSVKIKELLASNNLLLELEKNEKYFELCTFILSFEPEKNKYDLFFDIFQLLFEITMEKVI